MRTHPAPRIPERLFTDQVIEDQWRARFTAARISLPDWARDMPNHSLYISNVSGTWEVYAWDRDSDSHRQVTDRPNGTHQSSLSPDGETIWWFDDKNGDEFGQWVVEPFSGRNDGVSPQPAFIGIHEGYPAGLAIGHRVRAVGASTDDGSTLWISRQNAPAEVIYTSKYDAGISALSRNEDFLVISHSEHGDSRHPALRVVDVATGTVVSEKWDGKGKGLNAIDFSPLPGDSRLLVSHERHDKDELLIWDVRADTEKELILDLPGEVNADWYADGSALLIAHTDKARTSLYCYHLASETLSPISTPQGTVGSATVRPDGTVEYSWSSAANPALIRSHSVDGTDDVLLTPLGHRAAPSVDVEDVFVHGPGGKIHALVAKPPSSGTAPLPTIFAIHGGPHAMDEDRFSAYRAVWIDAGFAVVQINYRGSTGYGSSWRDAIEGRPGLTELEDIAAVHDWAVESGLTDPTRCVINGASWGGYLTLLALGTQPERWSAGVAGIPVADYVAAYEDEMEPLRAFDRALFGGSPAEVPERYRDCSPITYVDKVKAPVLILAGENDPRCPIRQVNNYLDRLAELGANYEMYRYEAGHGSFVINETITQTAIEVDFTRRMLGMEP